jgi:hypothetical protein
MTGISLSVMDIKIRKKKQRIMSVQYSQISKEGNGEKLPKSADILLYTSGRGNV